ncbi:MAG TPA: acyltransferase family protein [Novosphingobium sp.]|nr:acyltransferase family protein [Novosphingobium sp.]
MTYRAEIDGLRTVAVSSVILFHFDVPGTPGGYLGVDAFFVISGYLITQLLMADVEKGQLSLLDFYRRRTIRILPALLVMVLAICAIGIPVLFPAEIRVLAMSGAATSAYVANFFFQQQSDYFDVSEIKPLLHTWSLAVEEQFYIAYPVALLLLHRWLGERLRPVLWLMAISGLLLFWLVGRNHPGAAFFLAPTRAWELLLGGVAAIGGFPRLARPRTRAAAGMIGLALLLAAMILPPGPEPATRGMVMACLGTAILLVYGTQGPAARILSLPPMRWVGKISYSLYLWHLPLRELYRAGFEPSLDWRTSAALFGVSFVLAVLSYYLVEQPVRTRFRKGFRPGPIVAIGVTASLASMVICIAIALLAPKLRPLPPDVARIAAYASYKDGPAFRYQHVREDCRVGGRQFDIPRCIAFRSDRPNILVLGDSHAGHIWRAIAERFPADNVVVASSNGCRPLFGTGGRNYCAEMVERMRRQVIGMGKVEAVVLAANWRPKDLPGLEPTIAEIRQAGVRVTVLGPIMRYESDAPQLIAKAMLRKQAFRVSESRRRYVAGLDAEVRIRAQRAHARYYSLYRAECPQDRCRVLTPTGAPFHFDRAHFTMDGAREAIDALPRP